MAEQPLNTQGVGIPGAESETDESGGWLRRNWKAIGAGLLGLLAMMSGGMELMLIGLLLVAAAAVALLKPETFEMVGEAISGFWNRRVEPAVGEAAERVVDGASAVVDRVEQIADRIMPDRGAETLTAEQLRTSATQAPKMTAQEQAFETWALGQVEAGTIQGETTNHLQAVLNKMRDGADNQNATLDAAQMDSFVNGLPENLRAAAREKLNVITPSQ